MDDQELEKQYHPENFEPSMMDLANLDDMYDFQGEIDSPFDLDLERLFGGR